MISIATWKKFTAGSVVILTFLAVSHHVQAMQYQSLEEIANTARAYAYEKMAGNDNNLEVTVGRLDQRLRLQQCNRQLEAFSHGYSNKQVLRTVGIRCDSEKPWSLYVPVNVKIFKQVAVLQAAVSRNEPLTEADIVFEKRNINRLTSGYFTDINEIKGKILSQNLPPGTILTQHLVKSPMAIKRGQLVTLIAKNSAIEVRSEGKALSRGAIGDRIRVKNLKTERIVEGVIMENRLINVNL